MIFIFYIKWDFIGFLKNPLKKDETLKEEDKKILREEYNIVLAIFHFYIQ